MRQSSFPPTTILAGAIAAGASFLPLVAEAAPLPVGPITFTTNADYDNNFKPDASGNLVMVAGAGTAGYLRTTSGATALAGAAVYDTSVTAGSGGTGGTGGTDANNEFGSVTLSASVYAANRGGASALGFFWGLNGSEANGYLGIVSFATSSSPFQIRFDLYEGVGLTVGAAPTGLIYTQTINTATAAATFYPFQMTVVNDGSSNLFSFDFNNGAATGSHTDLTPTATVGQVGVYVRAQANSNSRLDNFAVALVPEPSAVGLAMIGGLGMLGMRRRR